MVPELPDGWRWESYGGVEVGVPDWWGWGNGDQRLDQWTVGDGQGKRPMVGRSGPVTLVGYARVPEGATDPATLVENTGATVAFGRGAKYASDASEAGDRTTLRRHGVEVRIQAEASLRAQIVDTFHSVDVDSFGCASTHPVSVEPSRRPSPAVDVTELTGVSAVAAGKYRVGRDDYDSDARLLSSLRLVDDAARAAIEGIVALELGSGPNDPTHCLPEVSYGDELVVLGITSDKGESEVYLRYSGCDHHGFDDGLNVRRLTAGAMVPFLCGPNTVVGSLSSGMARLIWRDR
jgi:hypothetical protein